MASARDSRAGLRVGAGLLAVALTAVLVWFGSGLQPRWPLVWFAPLPVLVFAAGAAWWSAALVAALGWFLGTLNLWHYLHDVLHLPGAGQAELLGAEALVFTAAVLLHRALLRRGASGWAIAAFPSVWVAHEYLLALASPHGTAGSLAYTQLEFRPLLQLASLTGPWAMTFVVTLFPAALAAAWQLRGDRRRALRVAGPSFVAIAAALGFGAVRLAGPPPGPTVKVGLIASDPPASPEVAKPGAATAALLDGYAARAAALAAQGAQVIVVPEKLGVTIDRDTPAADARLQAVADATRAVIVVGLIRVAAPAQYNEARIYAPGAPVQAYDKQHLLPPFESPFRAGTELALVPRADAAWGVAICKDMDFTPLSRDYGRAGVGLMLVPAWDFVLDRAWHGHMAVMRGVESGFAVVRAAKGGYLTVSDSRGRIVAETPSNAAPFATLLADVSAGHDATLYLALGDWFAWLALAVLAAALLQLIRVRRPGTARR